jgi:hypothetical protein
MTKNVSRSDYRPPQPSPPRWPALIAARLSKHSVAIRWKPEGPMGVATGPWLTSLRSRSLLQVSVRTLPGHTEMLSKIQLIKFNLMASADCDQPHGFAVPVNHIVELPMSNTSVKVAIALFMVLTPPAASFARGGHGGFAAMGGFARPAGSAAMGNVPISGIARGPANAGGMNNVLVDPSGVGNASRIARLPQPNITAPAIPKFQ